MAFGLRQMETMESVNLSLRNLNAVNLDNGELALTGVIFGSVGRDRFDGLDLPQEKVEALDIVLMDQDGLDLAVAALQINSENSITFNFELNPQIADRVVDFRLENRAVPNLNYLGKVQYPPGMTRVNWDRFKQLHAQNKNKNAVPTDLDVKFNRTYNLIESPKAAVKKFLNLSGDIGAAYRRAPHYPYSCVFICAQAYKLMLDLKMYPVLIHVKDWRFNLGGEFHVFIVFKYDGCNYIYDPSADQNDLRSVIELQCNYASFNSIAPVVVPVGMMDEHLLAYAPEGLPANPIDFEGLRQMIKMDGEEPWQTLYFDLTRKALSKAPSGWVNISAEEMAQIAQTLEAGGPIFKETVGQNVRYAFQSEKGKVLVYLINSQEELLSTNFLDGPGAFREFERQEVKAGRLHVFYTQNHGMGSGPLILAAGEALAIHELLPRLSAPAAWDFKSNAGYAEMLVQQQGGNNPLDSWSKIELRNALFRINQLLKQRAATLMTMENLKFILHFIRNLILENQERSSWPDVLRNAIIDAVREFVESHRNLSLNQEREIETLGGMLIYALMPQWRQILQDIVSGPFSIQPPYSKQLGLDIFHDFYNELSVPLGLREGAIQKHGPSSFELPAAAMELDLLQDGLINDSALSRQS